MSRGFQLKLQSKNGWCLPALTTLLFWLYIGHTPVFARESEVSSVQIASGSTNEAKAKIKAKTVGKRTVADTSRGSSEAGWVIKIANDKFGRSTYSFSRTRFKAETPMLLVVADAKKDIVTIGTWETRKSFTFPVNKSRYYADLMGLRSTKTGSDFRRDYQQSPWVKLRTLMVDEMPAVEYTRHVINPPPGRTRTQIQTVSQTNVLAPSLLTIYYRLAETTPAADMGLVLGDRVIITNPKQGWIDLEPKSAKKAILTSEEMRFPDGFKKVDSVSELFLSDQARFDSEAGKSTMVSPLGKSKRTVR